MRCVVTCDLMYVQRLLRIFWNNLFIFLLALFSLGYFDLCAIHRSIGWRKLVYVLWYLACSNCVYELGTYFYNISWLHCLCRMKCLQRSVLSAHDPHAFPLLILQHTFKIVFESVCCVGFSCFSGMIILGHSLYISALFSILFYCLYFVGL